MSAACLVVACGNQTPSAPGVSYDPSLAPDLADASARPDGEDEREAGRPDAARRDAGTADAGVSDAQTAEAAAADGEAADAIVPDDARAVERGAFSAVERLLVADGKQPRVYALDTQEQRLLVAFTLSAPGRVYAGASGHFGYFVQGDANVMNILDMGLPEPSALSEAPALTEVQLLPASFHGMGPSAFSAHGHSAALLFEGSAEVITFDELALATTARSESLALGAPHHGIALHLGERIVLSQKPAGSAEASLRVYDAQLAPVAGVDLPCTAPEGAARVGNNIAVGCAEGVLRWDGTQARSRLVAYPASATNPTARVRRLSAHPSEDAFLTVYDGQLCLLRSAFTCVALPAAEIDHAFDAVGKRALLLTRDGALHVFEGETLAPQGKLSLLSAQPDGATEQELPALAVGRRHVYVPDPQAAAVHVVDAATLQTVARYEISGGFPTKIAVFNYSR